MHFRCCNTACGLRADSVAAAWCVARRRSPWSNEYFPPIDPAEGGGYTPPERLRKLEVEANELFDAYRELCVMCTGRQRFCVGVAG